MSRLNVAKSRAEKSGVKGTGSGTGAVARDIVPGKFTESDW